MFYTGKWHENLRSGIGRMVYPDGGRYLGSWSNDKKNGDGRYTYPDGSSYSGAWLNDTKHGYGTYTFTDGSQYAGSFVDGEFVSGEWRLAGNTVYFGNFKNDVPVGKGVFVFKKGQEGSYRQEGSYKNGKWVSGEVAPVDALPSIEIIVQQQPLSLAFSRDCGGLPVDTLVQVSNFGPFLQWLNALDNNADRIRVQSLSVSSVEFEDDKSLSQVRLNVVAVDREGKRLRGTDSVVLKNSTTRLLVILAGGDKTLAVLEKAPAVGASSTKQLRLPSVRSTLDGALHGAFVTAVEKPLRLTLSRQNTTSLVQQSNSNLHFSNAAEDVIVYIQHVHADAIATLQAKLDSCAAGFSSYHAVRVQEILNQSTDALTILAAAQLEGVLAAGTLPDATIDAQRPPTPIPPATEPRPNIEPLLEEDRRNAEKAKSGNADED
jgi:hypothetical protein